MILDADPFQTLLEQAFPFYLACDRQLRIRRAGRSSLKLLPDCCGNLLSDLFSPLHAGEELTYAGLVNNADKFTAWRINSAGLLFRGQVFVMADELILLIRPSCDTPQQLTELGLTIGDFASADSSMMELLFVKQAQATQLTDLQSMVTKLKDAAQENERILAAEAALAHDLNAAGDICIRFDQTGRVLSYKSVRRECSGESFSAGENSLFEVVPEVANIVHSGTLSQGPQAVHFMLPDCRSHYEGRVATTLEGNYLLVARDITERRNFQTRLEHQANHDSLTDLPNRSLFYQRAANMASKQQPLVVLLIDLDDFKSINDTLGHHAGDQLLQVISRRLKACVGPGDVPARLGGDEFAVVTCSLSSEAEAFEYAERICSTLTQGTEVSSQVIVPGVSIGVAMQEPCSSIEETMRDADFAMYEAKSSAGAQVVFCDAQLRAQRADKLELKQDLLRGITNHQFTPFFQPILDLKSWRIQGFEALARWNHPERGLLGPYHFIELAEETGAIAAIGEQILVEACRALDTFHSLPSGNDLHVNVNLAAQQAQDNLLPERVTHTLQASGQQASHLVLEITESAMIERLEEAKQNLSRVRELGVRIALDDFGSGYSSLNYIQQFPIDILKLDRRFMSEICTAPAQQPIVECVMQLGKALGLSVVSEGIETTEQLTLLQQMKCHFGQGFLISKPMSLKAACEFFLRFNSGWYPESAPNQAPINIVEASPNSLSLSHQN